jgi:hypothetical protein
MTWGVKRAPEAGNFPKVPTHRRVGVRVLRGRATDVVALHFCRLNPRE